MVNIYNKDNYLTKQTLCSLNYKIYKYLYGFRMIISVTYSYIKIL